MQLERLLNRADATGSTPQGARGVFLEDVPDVDSLAEVVLDGAEGIKYDEVRWMPRGAVMPSAGDECIVVFDDEGAPWITGWWPV